MPSLAKAYIAMIVAGARSWHLVSIAFGLSQT